MPGPSSKPTSHDPSHEASRDAAAPSVPALPSGMYATQRPPGDRGGRRQVRVTNICATPWHVTGGSAGRELPDYLQLWRFEHYYRLSADQLPRVLCREALEVGALWFRRWRLGGRVTGARMWLFCLPSGQVVAALSLDAGCGLGDTIGLLEDCYFADIQIGGSRAQAYAHAMAVQLGAADGQADQAFLPERHQLVCAGAWSIDPDPRSRGPRMGRSSGHRLVPRWAHLLGQRGPPPDHRPARRYCGQRDWPIAAGKIGRCRGPQSGTIARLVARNRNK